MIDISIIIKYNLRIIMNYDKIIEIRVNSSREREREKEREMTSLILCKNIKTRMEAKRFSCLAV